MNFGKIEIPKPEKPKEEKRNREVKITDAGEEIKKIKEIKITDAGQKSAELELKRKQELKDKSVDKSRRLFIKTAITTLGAAGALTAASRTKTGHNIIKSIGDIFRKEEVTKKPPTINDNLEEGNSTEKNPEAIEIKPEKTKEKIEYSEKEKAQHLLNIYAEALNQLTSKEQYFPKELFTSNFFTAIEIQESRGKEDAESKSGAVGVMQVKSIAIEDVRQFLDNLEKNGEIDPIIPEEISEETMAEIKKLIKSSAELGRIVGKLHFINNFKRYGVSEREYKNRNIKEAQRLLAAAYNGGHSIYTMPENEWRKETKNYAPSVMNYIERLENIQKEFQKLNIKSNNNDFLIHIAIEMNKYPDTEKRYEWMREKASKIKEMESITNKKLAEKHFKEILKRT